VARAAGDDWLGGNDFDRVIVEWIARAIREQYGIDPVQNARLLYRIREVAERAKITLGNRLTVSIHEHFVRQQSRDPITLDLEFSRVQFEAAIAPLVDQTMGIVRWALAQERLTPQDIAEVLPFGGSTQVRLVQSRLAEFFGNARLASGVDAVSCAALGAAKITTRPDLAEQAQRSWQRRLAGIDTAVTEEYPGPGAIANLGDTDEVTGGGEAR